MTLNEHKNSFAPLKEYIFPAVHLLSCVILAGEMIFSLFFLRARYALSAGSFIALISEPRNFSRLLLFLSLTLLTLLCLTGSFLIKKIRFAFGIKKSRYLQLFLLALSFYHLKILFYFPDSYILSEELLYFLSKLLYFFRFLALIGLWGLALDSSRRPLSFQPGTLSIGVLLFLFLFTMNSPLNSSRRGSNLLYTPIESGAFWSFFLIFATFILLYGLYRISRDRETHYLFLLISIFFLLSGEELFFFCGFDGKFLPFAFLSLGCGTLLFIRKISLFYLKTFPSPMREKNDFI